MRHAGLIVEDIDAEIAFFESLGFEVVIHRHEEWAHRRLEVVKMKRPDERTMIELVKVITGEWSPHICLGVESWPLNIMIRRLGEPFDDDIEVGFCVSPNGNVVELVKPMKMEDGSG